MKSAVLLADRGVHRADHDGGPWAHAAGWRWPALSPVCVKKRKRFDLAYAISGAVVFEAHKPAPMTVLGAACFTSREQGEHEAGRFLLAGHSPRANSGLPAAQFGGQPTPCQALPLYISGRRRRCRGAGRRCPRVNAADTRTVGRVEHRGSGFDDSSSADRSCRGERLLLLRERLRMRNVHLKPPSLKDSRMAAWATFQAASGAPDRLRCGRCSTKSGGEACKGAVALPEFHQV